MKLFGTQPLVCCVCRVHFEGEPEFERWAAWCPEHRKSVMARDILKDRVMEWAGRNWEELIPHVSAHDPKLLPLVQEAKEIINLPDNKKLLE